MERPPRERFLRAACAPLDSGHASGTLDEANALLGQYPGLASHDIFCAAVLGDAPGVRGFLLREPSAATAKSPPHDWDALTCLCFSRYLRLERDRSAAFVAAATALLDAGANPNTGWFDPAHQPHPQWESAIYGAAGVAKHPGVTQILLDRGADPNDGETPYHVPETYDNAALRVLLASGKLTADSLATLLLRKADWHDGDGMRLVLDAGADPNRLTVWHYTALHQALRRDNALENITLLLDRGGNPALPDEAEGRSAAAWAALRGRGDVLELLERRGMGVPLTGMERLAAACARADAGQARAIADREPGLLTELGGARGTTMLVEFAGTGNTAGIRLLLDLGVDVSSTTWQGDGYWGLARNSTALHVAAWRARHDTVRLLIDRGAPVDARDGEGRTALMLAVRACVDSYWTERRSPQSVAALLAAGASPSGIPYPTGYDEVDRLLASHGR